MNTDSFIANTYNRIRESIINIDVNRFPDIYAISFYKDNLDDDPRCPTLTIGFNTVSQQNAAAVASDAAEARWNYAFWLQNEELLIGDGEYDPVSDWVKQLPENYTDEQIQQQFMEIVISHARKLHDEGVIRKKFGVDIPVIIHELEYYDLPLDWTKRGNPKGLVNEFEEWIDSF